MVGPSMLLDPSSWRRGDRREQTTDLEATSRNAYPGVVVSGAPHDLARVIDVDVPIVRVRFEHEEKNLRLSDVVDRHADMLGC